MKMSNLARPALATLLLATAPFLWAQGTPPKTFKADPAHSFVNFAIKNRGTAFVYGRFNNLQGTVTVSPDNLAATAIDVTVAAQSVDTNNDKRDNHLRSKDFFNVPQFPQIHFIGTGATKVSEGVYEMNGSLTLKGVTKPLAIKFNHTGSRTDPQSHKQSVGGFCTFQVKRSDFGMDFMAGKGIDDMVTVTVSIEANET